MKARIQNPLATFPFIEPRRVVRSAIPGKGVWDAREEAWELMRPASQRAILTRLREAFAEGERALTGWPEILTWLHEHGLRNREGRALKERTVRGWARRLGFPVLRGVCAFPGRGASSPPWTSTYLTLAWAVSLFSSGMRGRPRIERPGTPIKRPRGLPILGKQSAPGTCSALGLPTCARPTRPAPAPERRRLIPPQHG